MYYIYILLSKKNRRLYVGYTVDLRRRLREHQKGLVPSTKKDRPWELIYYEAYRNKWDALRREKFFKSGWGKNYIRKILRNYLNPQILRFPKR